MEALFSFESLINFITLSGLEIILGVDNIIFLAIIAYNIPVARRSRVVFFGVSLAIALRIAMLTGASWVMGVTAPLFSILSQEFSARSLLLIAGGVFLLIKSILELQEMLLPGHKASGKQAQKLPDTELKIILQIIFVDLIFSFDSVLVAVAMVSNLLIIIAAIFVSMVFMLASTQLIGDFMHSNPSIKILGLNFVLLIGAFIFLSGIGIELSKGYIYAAMFFSLVVEIMSIRVRKLRSPSTSK